MLIVMGIVIVGSWLLLNVAVLAILLWNARARQQHDAFIQALESAPPPSAALRKLLSSKSPWEETNG